MKIILFAIGGLAILALGWATLAVQPTSGFWPDVIANLLATLIGVGAGIPAGLAISSIWEKQNARTEEVKILAMLRDELYVNRDALSEIAGDRRDLPAVMAAATRLVDEYWHSVSNSGKVGVIRDPELTNKLAGAYVSVNALRLLANLFFRNDPLVRLIDAPGFTHHFDERWWKEVEEAQKRIADAVAAIGNQGQT